MKKIKSMIATLSTFIAVTASGQAMATTDTHIPYIKKTIKTLKLAHGLPAGSSYDQGAQRFSNLVEIYTRGEVKVKVYPGGQLGKEADLAKDIQLGTLDLGLVAINNASKWYKPMDVFIMPFIFRNREHANAVIDGPVGKEIFANYKDASGMDVVSVFEWGDRAIMNKTRAINKPDDLKGIKIRVPKNKVMIDTYNALGANATAIDWGELYSALQQGVADGLEGPPQGMIDMKFNDFLDYYSYINIYYGTAVILMNDRTLQKFSPENQAAIARAGQEAGIYQRWLSTVSHTDGLSKMEELGVNVNIVDDRQAFVDKVQPVWDKYRDIIGGEWFDKVAQAK
jgi:tripartite ATP-independent transporter DctP family solute receptor